MTMNFKKYYRFTALSILLMLATACSADSEKADQQSSNTESTTLSAETTATVSEPRATHSALLKTTLGDIKLELYGEAAPITVKNFVDYANSDFYDGTIFHRVIDGFMIQGGGLNEDYQQKPTNPPIKNEATNKLKNRTGTIAMARTGVIDSATSQFFINVADNRSLDHTVPSPTGFGYAVFGKVTSGMDVVGKIKAAEKTRRGPHQNAPVENIVITDIEIETL